MQVKHMMLIKNQLKIKNTTVKQTTQPTNNKTVSTPAVSDHQAYINKTNPGGLDAYTKLQQERFSGAYATGDQLN